MNHEVYIKRCLVLAKKGLRTAMPNPSVGAVLVHRNRIIGEGCTSPYGGPHGEVNCINSVLVKDRPLIREATLYVSLEPCSHYGKTPPCCDLIIQNEIPTIVIGTTDPHEKVAGNGIRKLQDEGKTVIVGVLEQECRDFNRRFFTFHEQKRPYIILKWAQSADGYLSPKNERLATDGIESKKPIWITNSYSRQLVHKWRSEEMAIAVGTQTVIDDNPKLDVRNWTGKNPVRVVLDRNNRIDTHYAVKDKSIKTICLTEKTGLTNTDNLVYETVVFDENLAKTICDVLYKHNLQSVIIEGGAKTLQTFITATIWDEARVFKGATFFGSGTKAPVLQAPIESTQTILTDELVYYKNKNQHTTK
ncbi:bifunctional diaminohydroxyphosphoribosylaminopyrimidine deaminase/5-amino-6-(5-phosphoribosylamino)uracil reductase RibD [Flavobacterium litorale]|uniref:Riboflavin biosynthesis protein RibD n=1 Tax=Flavobacterium litorale TaxID=2856519 RepID=A0ABX8VBW0_9FLAO|nr:bifunctional diaminohydroxyphosphoribosylaminopyrimidine deaminase/5-amino-6-(5-phosphoribosylamino)uracil reductase RibD [Flavobacterium litorale]QYJ68305.1 bifunctional diaminohydroxyphosphoribosylaminopyrimidine deaminase/5-amino-6-(5-phosphoribosylamino)uracil reductase RibD [Flavobacterium litorale]